MGRAAGAPADPMAGFTLTGQNRPGGMLGEDMGAVAAFELSQALTVPGKLRRREEAVGAERLVLEAQLAAERRSLVAEIRAAYARLFTWQHEADAVRQTGELLDLLIAGTISRYEAGEGDLAMPAELQLERVRLEVRLDDLAAERAEIVAELNALLDRPAATPVRAGASLPASRMSLPFDQTERDALAEGALAHSAEIALAAAEVEAAARKVRSARLERWPDLVLGGEYGYRAELDPMVSARIGVELPVWKGKKQDAELRAAEHSLRAAEESSRQMRARVRAEATSILERLAVADRQVRRYEEELLPAWSLVVESRRSAYQTGRGGARELLEAERMRLMAQAEAARRQADRYEAEARWEALAGVSSQAEGERR